MSDQNEEDLTWFYNYYGSGFLTILKHEISETTPLLKYSTSVDTDSYMAMFQNKDEKSKVRFLILKSINFIS